MALVATPVDPRDIGWEVDAPAFRVHLWRRQAGLGWECSEWELVGGDVDAVLAWTDEHAAGWDVVEVWVVVPATRTASPASSACAGTTPTSGEVSARSDASP